MKKSIMMLIAGSIATATLTGCSMSEIHPRNCPYPGESAPAAFDNRDSLERQGFVKTGATEYMKPNAYGPGIGMNQFGAPVKTVPANGF